MSVIRRAGRRVQFRNTGRGYAGYGRLYQEPAPLRDQVVAFPTLYQLKQWWPSQRLRVVARMTWGVTTRPCPGWMNSCACPASANTCAACPRANASINLHHSSERYGLVSLLRRPALRMGFRNNRLSDGAWTHSHPRTSANTSAPANLRLLGTYRSFDPHQAALNCFREIAEQRKRPVAPVDVVMIPGGGSGPFKRWSIAHYIRWRTCSRPRSGAARSFPSCWGRTGRQRTDQQPARVRNSGSSIAGPFRSCRR